MFLSELFLCFLGSPPQFPNSGLPLRSKDGQNASLPSAGGSSLVSCQAAFRKKFRDKSGTDWDDRANYTPVAGKYEWVGHALLPSPPISTFGSTPTHPFLPQVKLDYGGGDDDDEDDDAGAGAAKQEPSKLPKPVKSLVEMIFDVTRMKQAVKEMQYDDKKLPLGKLTQEQIKAGYQALKEIETAINKKVSAKALAEASDNFYTKIPHDFGMKRPPVIKDVQTVKEKLQLLEALADIKVALKIIKDDKGSTKDPVCCGAAAALGSSLSPLLSRQSQPLPSPLTPPPPIGGCSLRAAQVRHCAAGAKERRVQDGREVSEQYARAHSQRLQARAA